MGCKAASICLCVCNLCLCVMILPLKCLWFDLVEPRFRNLVLVCKEGDYQGRYLFFLLIFALYFFLCSMLVL